MAPLSIFRQSPWLVDSLSWRVSRASDRYAGHNKYEIHAAHRIAVQMSQSAPGLGSILFLLLAAGSFGCGGEPSAGGAGPAGPVSAVSATADEAGALRADAAWIAALERNDGAALHTLLDAEFEWTDSHGRTRARADSLEAAAMLRADLSGETEVQTYHYGHLEVITSARPGARMMRIWASRPEGWRALALISTTTATGATPFAATASGAGDCENPCRTMPYVPASDNTRTIAAIFQQLKVDEWHPDPVRWSPYVLDDVYYVTATARLSKADRVARLTTLRDTGAPSVPGDPVESMRIVDLGDSAVMMARHTPYRGGKPYYSVRAWAFRDGRWQLANTQQTAISDE